MGGGWNTLAKVPCVLRRPWLQSTSDDVRQVLTGAKVTVAENTSAPISECLAPAAGHCVRLLQYRTAPLPAWNNAPVIPSNKVCEGKLELRSLAT